MQPSLLLSPVLEVEPNAAMTLGESKGERSLEDMTLLTAMAFPHQLYPFSSPVAQCDVSSVDFLAGSMALIAHLILERQTDHVYI